MPNRAGQGKGKGREQAPEEIRLQVYLARAGVASRRASEELIRAGRVKVNGRRAELGMKVAVTDTVLLDGEPVDVRRSEWIALHKPRGYVTTREDPEGRKTVYDLLPSDLHHLFHVGRLDRESSGILLLTNDGQAANRLLHPRYGTTKEYLVDVEGEPSGGTLKRLVEGVDLGDGMAHAVSAELRGEIRPGVHRLVVVLREGRNREIRRMMETVGHPVKRLFRRSFGPLTVGKLRPGQWRRLTAEETEGLGGRPRRKR